MWNSEKESIISDLQIIFIYINHHAFGYNRNLLKLNKANNNNRFCGLWILGFSLPQGRNAAGPQE